MDRTQPALLPNLAMAAAAVILDTHYGEALCAFVAGPALFQEEGTANIELVVLCPQADPARQDAVIVDGFKIKVFVEDPDSLPLAFEREAAQGRTAMVQRVAQGRVVGADMATALHWQKQARQLLATAPDVAVAAVSDR